MSTYVVCPLPVSSHNHGLELEFLDLETAKLEMANG